MGEGTETERFSRQVVLLPYIYMWITSISLLECYKKIIFRAIFLSSSSGRILGLERSLHRYGEHSEEVEDGDRRRRIELCHGNLKKKKIIKIKYHKRTNKNNR